MLQKMISKKVNQIGSSIGGLLDMGQKPKRKAKKKGFRKKGKKRYY